MDETPLTTYAVTLWQHSLSVLLPAMPWVRFVLPCALPTMISLHKEVQLGWFDQNHINGTTSMDAPPDLVVGGVNEYGIRAKYLLE